MATLNLRGLPKELVARVKAQAALDGETILQWVRRVLEAQFGAGAGVSSKAPAAEVKAKDTAFGEVDEGGIQEHGVDGLGLRECPGCGRRLLENRKLRKRTCEDEQCGYQEPIRSEDS